MSLPLAKRRKLESAAALSRPFKSPMRKKPKEDALLDQFAKPNPAEVAAATIDAKIVPNEISSTQAQAHAHRHYQQLADNSYTASRETTQSTAARKSLPAARGQAASEQASEIRTLQRENTALLNQLTALRSTLDISTQALTITHTTHDDELERLVMLWKTVSRSAIEDLFAIAKDQVYGMGGLGAWREKERERWEGWGDRGGGVGEEKVSGVKDEGSEYEREDMLKGERVRKGEGDFEEDEIQKVWEESENDDSAFTIDIMLRSLNIELDIVGYDKDLQMWTD